MRTQNLRQRSWPMRVVLHYANAKPTARSWRKVVLGPFSRSTLSKRTELPDGPVFGIKSLEELCDILGEYRAFLVRVMTQRDPKSVAASDVARELAAKASLAVRGFGWDETTKRLLVRWTTTDESFGEMLYGFLALALQERRYDALYQCPACGKFEWERSEHRQKYCSQRCRNRALVQQYRKQHPEKYRAYHRTLMRKRRAEGKE